MYAYIVLSLLVGIRTEEARALRWDHVNLRDDPNAKRAVPPHVGVWRSVRLHGETRRPEARGRTLALPRLAVEALGALQDMQAHECALAGEQWEDSGLAFTTQLGAPLDPANVRKMFKRVCKAVGLGDSWTPQELRTSFVEPDESPRRQYRGNRPVGRPLLHPDHRGRVPPGTAAGDHDRRRDHGRCLPEASRPGR